MQPTDTGPLTPEEFNQQHASLVAKAEAISNRRDANLVEAAAALNARYGGNETPKTLLTRIAQSLPDLPYRPNPKKKATTMPTTETIKAFTEREMSLNLTPETFAHLTDFPDLPEPPTPESIDERHDNLRTLARTTIQSADAILSQLGQPLQEVTDTTMQKLHPTTINGAITQIVAQPGDGTRYRIILTECPVDDLVGAPQHLLSAMTGDKGRSMFITIDYKNVRDGGFYLHPTYIEEKFGPGSTYLSKMVAHTMNLLFSKTYITILKNLLSLPTDERDHLPPVFQTDKAIKTEIAHPHAIWNSRPGSVYDGPEFSSAGLPAE